jgi:hypothetical protein
MGESGGALTGVVEERTLGIVTGVVEEGTIGLVPSIQRIRDSTGKISFAALEYTSTKQYSIINIGEFRRNIDRKEI